MKTFIALLLFLSPIANAASVFDDVVIEDSCIVPTLSQGDQSTHAASTAYVDTAVSAATIPDATTIIKGKLKLAGDLAGTADLPTVPGLAGKEPTITAGTTAQYWRGDKTFQTLNTSVVPESSNLYWTQARFDTAFGAKTTSNLSEGSNLYFTTARAQAAISASPPLTYSTGVVGCQTANASQAGCLSAADWSVFNAKLDASAGNYITNPDAAIDTAGWNLYNNAGNTVAAHVTDQDITYTSLTSGNGGNGQTVSYQLGTSPYAEPPVITCPTGSSAVVKWYNGPTIAQNPTATVLKAAWDASCAVTMATATITGTASNRQYQTGTVTLADGGDTSPTNGTGGSVTGVTITRSTLNPLGGVADLVLGKDAASRQGMGVSTDFTIQSFDRGVPLQISFIYQGSAAMALGTSSDVRVFIYDVTNATLIPVTPLKTLAGPVSTIKTYVGKFTSSQTSVLYRLIFHVATTNASAWDLRLHGVTVNDQISPVAATQVPSVVLPAQPISGSVTDHMVVMWRDGATQWVPATIAGAAISAFGTDKTQLGFATNIVGSVADVYVSGSMGGFSFGPFAGYEQYIDNTAGSISPLPSPFTDLYVMVGMAVASDTLNIQFDTHLDLIANASGVPIKGGLLTSSAVNDGTGDLVLSPGANNSVLVANSAAARGLNYVTTLTGINTTGSAATLTTARTIAGTSFNGSANITLANKFIVQGTTDAGLSGPQFLGALATGLVKNTTTTGVLSIAAASDVTGQLLTGYVSGAGTVAATDTILQGVNKLNGNNLLKANAASPVFTGDVNSSTGNVLVSTIGKGLQVKTGTNSKIGQATLSSGAVTVANTSVTANSRIFLTVASAGGTQGFLRTSKVASTSFTITSTSVLETSIVDWVIVESIP